MSKYFFLLPVAIIVGLGGFAAFWCLIVKLLSLAGWQRLAQYQVPAPLPGPRTSLGWAQLNGVRYQSVIRAGTQAEGLALEAFFLFQVGHPPLLIPWAAIGPVLTEKAFWSTYYSTTIRTDGGSVSFRFANDRLAQELQALPLAGR
ncbi:hypothetical protein MON38_01090 [Hymenobacter sp. DH14]|uniref:Uncharacterized protein n=1 Tax=Hymenobacter cyanobacteriorum TaxID=2926463 RepID=A0A9X1VFL3_9BACT|nr:hypothetical protein [Hymenobacter cyanobacteriorum]MCI1185996.1 hypothetical protein [Hymenobacter cyanobacteriorum]